MGPELLNPNACLNGLPNSDAPKNGRAEVLGSHVSKDDPALQGAITPVNHYFSPYENNGGTVVSVSGPDYTIVASDTRLGHGFTIPSRYVSRILKLTDRAVLASSGMQSDIAILHKMLKMKLIQYRHNHHKDMSLTAISQLLSTTLYYRRFQPYYTFNVLGGIDEEGNGWSYGYDAVGSHEKVPAVCSGTGQSLLQPVLDNQVEFRQMTSPEQKKKLSLQECVDLIKDGFTSTCERDIYTGDTVEICKVTASGVEIEKFELRQD